MKKLTLALLILFSCNNESKKEDESKAVVLEGNEMARAITVPVSGYRFKDTVAGYEINWYIRDTTVTANISYSYTKTLVDSTKRWIAGTTPPPVDTTTIPQPVTSLSIEGFGKTKGGEGQQQVHVTSTSNLLGQIQSNRYIWIDKGGTYIFRGNFENLVNVTIDGSKADGPVIIDNRNNGGAMIFESGCHDIIVRSVSIRNAGDDNMAANNNAYKITFDHCSVYNAGDGGIDITNSHDITIQWCIIGSAVSGGSLIDYPGTRNVSIHHNLYLAFERNALIGSQQKTGRTDLVCDFVNNLVWKWQNFGTDVNFNATANLRNNYYYSTSKPENAILTANQSYGPYPGGSAYVSGNISGNGTNLDKQSNHTWFSVPVDAQITMQSACAAAKLILANAGPVKKDAIDINALKITLVGCPAN